MSRDLLFEIGVEEIPSAPLDDAIEQLRRVTPRVLADVRLEHGDVEVFGAPRRLVVRVRGLAERQQDVRMRVKGPAARAAFDESGAPTKAAEGFARSRGVEVSDLVRDTDEGGEYVFAVVESAGVSAGEVLPGVLADLAAGIEWVKSQRWGAGETRFIRPVRWLLALHGADVVPVRFAGLEAGRVTWGHRFLSDGPVEVPSAEEYDVVAARARFVHDQAERARLVREGVEAAAMKADATPVVPPKTFAEVVNLVEWPTAAVGSFDRGFLDVPREVLETAMESHQRYFPLQDASGDLLAAFVVVHNGDPDRSEAIIAGHERVIRARLADASFFFAEDLKVPMEEWVGRLGSIVFHERLGDVGAKVARLELLAGELARLSGADPAVAAQAARAAHLCKADLVSHVVVEFPTLQGVMGRHYALAAGEDDAVADAIPEHYRPRYSGDEPPSTEPGVLVSAADRLDTICGMIGIGAGPTGSADPYALRRAAIGLLGMILDGRLAVKLDEAVDAAVRGYAGAGVLAPGTAASVLAFLEDRLEIIMKERGLAHDIVRAVLESVVAGGEDLPEVGAGRRDPADAFARARALAGFRETEGGADLLIAFRRAANLADAGVGNQPNCSVMVPAETALFEAVTAAEGRFHHHVDKREYDDALSLLADLRAPIDTFFDEVLVMDPDEGLRTNRLRILNRVVGLFGGFADLRQLEG